MQCFCVLWVLLIAALLISSWQQLVLHGMSPDTWFTLLLLQLCTVSKKLYQCGTLSQVLPSSHFAEIIWNLCSTALVVAGHLSHLLAGMSEKHLLRCDGLVHHCTQWEAKDRSDLVFTCAKCSLEIAEIKCWTSDSIHSPQRHWNSLKTSCLEVAFVILAATRQKTSISYCLPSFSVAFATTRFAHHW